VVSFPIVLFAVWMGFGAALFTASALSKAVVDVDAVCSRKPFGVARAHLVFEVCGF
jgi:hypothetical protein